MPTATRAAPPSAAADAHRALRLTQVTVELGGRAVVAGLNLDIERGQLVALIGPSGCGKTTLLRAIAGLQALAGGQIELAGRCVSTPTQALAAEQRSVGLVFQDLALFPHLDVAANVAFGLHRLPAAERTRRVRDLGARFHLDGLMQRLPQQLSGGQQQRVAIARAVAPQPALLLLDEPFSSLDASLRVALRREVVRTLRQLGTTALLVTHDQDEAFALADRVGIMIDGQLRQYGRPAEVWRTPADSAVAGFIGGGQLLAVEGDAHGRLRSPLGLLDALGEQPAPGSARLALIRPEQIERRHGGDGVAARVVAVSFRGALHEVELALADGLHVTARWASALPPEAGAQVQIAAAAGAYPHYPINGDDRLAH